MSAPGPSWYPDPQRDGTLRWWDGTRWTEHVQPGRAAGTPVLGQESTRGIGPVTFYRPDEPITHAFPPLTDDRYAGSPLAEALVQRARSGRAGEDVQIPAGDHAAVEAVRQLRATGGVLGALAGVGEQLVVETLMPRPEEAATSDTSGGARTASTAPGMSSPHGRAGYRAVGRAARGVVGAAALWRLVRDVVAGVLLLLAGVVLAVLVPALLPVALTLMGMGAVVLGVTAWELVGTRRSRPR